MDGMVLSYKRDFDYDKEEKFFLFFMKLIFVVFALLMIWGVYSHARNIELAHKGTPATASRHTGEKLTFVAEDGKTYYVDITSMFLDEFDETTTVYYLDNPVDAKPLTSIKFFLIIYAVSMVGMALTLWQIHRIKVSISKGVPVVTDDEY